MITANGLEFDAEMAGHRHDPLVLMLHGFPQTNHTWRHQLGGLAEAGYFAVAPNQRGYSAGARPAGRDSYATKHLVDDALAVAASLGHERFHVVGHDWGGQLAWLLAALHADRISSLTVLSRPHPAAFAQAMRSDAKQAERSKHHRAFQDPNTAARLLENDAARLRRTLSDQGVPEADIAAYLSVLNNHAALDAAVNWYRAATTGDSALAAPNVPPVDVSTLYIWGDADATVGSIAAHATGEFVTGAYRFEVLRDVGHFVTDQAGERVTQLLLAHLGSE
ncbi:MAG: alpha/beta hydrolase [Gammaproteobacteria bacterium]|nr:alpha/beta hydrolase [Gammaproteobacteria bacterium]